MNTQKTVEYVNKELQKSLDAARKRVKELEDSLQSEVVFKVHVHQIRLGGPSIDFTVTGSDLKGTIDKAQKKLGDSLEDLGTHHTVAASKGAFEIDLPRRHYC